MEYTHGYAPQYTVQYSTAHKLIFTVMHCNLENDLGTNTLLYKVNLDIREICEYCIHDYISMKETTLKE